jgi:hypothetical protein
MTSRVMTQAAVGGLFLLVGLTGLWLIFPLVGFGLHWLARMLFWALFWGRWLCPVVSMPI